MKAHCPRHEGWNKDCFSCFMHAKVHKAEVERDAARAECDQLRAELAAMEKDRNEYREKFYDYAAEVEERGVERDRAEQERDAARADITRLEAELKRWNE